MNRYVIVGNGVAGTTAAEQIRKIDEKGSVVVLSDEDIPFYYRVKLNDFIAGDVQEQKLIVKKEAWYREKGIELITKVRVSDADEKERYVVTEDGRFFDYDRLLIATGSHSFLPPVNGVEKNGVFALRNIADAREIRKYAEGIDSVILIGGGLLGIETSRVSIP